MPGEPVARRSLPPRLARNGIRAAHAVGCSRSTKRRARKRGALVVIPRRLSPHLRAPSRAGRDEAAGASM